MPSSNNCTQIPDFEEALYSKAGQSRWWLVGEMPGSAGGEAESRATRHFTEGGHARLARAKPVALIAICRMLSAVFSVNGYPQSGERCSADEAGSSSGAAKSLIVQQERKFADLVSRGRSAFSTTNNSETLRQIMVLAHFW